MTRAFPQADYTGAPRAVSFTSKFGGLKLQNETLFTSQLNFHILNNYTMIHSDKFAMLANGILNQVHMLYQSNQGLHVVHLLMAEKMHVAVHSAIFLNYRSLFLIALSFPNVRTNLNHTS